MSTERPAQLPSWQRWPPNCCETCVSGQPNPETSFEYRCNNGASLVVGERVDARYRCPAFERKEGV